MIKHKINTKYVFYGLDCHGAEDSGAPALFIFQVYPSLNIFKLSSSANDVNLIRCIPVNLFYVVHQRKSFRLKNIWMEIIFDCLL